MNETGSNLGTRRLAAFLLDHLVVAVYLAALAALSMGILRLGGGGWVAQFVDRPWKGQALGLFLVTLPWVMYHACWEASPLRATPGKLLLGLRVEGAGGGTLGLERATLRSAFKFLPWELTHACLWRIPGWPGQVELLPPGAVAGLGLVWLLVAAYLVSLLLGQGRAALYDRWSGARLARHGGEAIRARWALLGGATSGADARRRSPDLLHPFPPPQAPWESRSGWKRRPRRSEG